MAGGSALALASESAVAFKRSGRLKALSADPFLSYGVGFLWVGTDALVVVSITAATSELTSKPAD